MDTLLTVGIIIAAIVVIIVLAFIGIVLQGKREHLPAHRYAPP